MYAPTTASPLPSLTFPLTVLDWAESGIAATAASRTVINNVASLFISPGSYLAFCTRVNVSELAAVLNTMTAVLLSLPLFSP